MDIYSVLILITFCIGYFLITIEHILKINKTAVALLMAIICWIFLFINPNNLVEANLHALGEHISSISQVVFFLLGALAIVETISAHKGFNVISQYLHIRSKKKLLWVIGLVSFFMSAVLDNLTTTIIMVMLIRKLVESGEERLLMGGAVVIAANAGGAWTPIGDVTTTMLWIGGQVSTVKIMTDLFLPSLTCLVISLLCIGFFLKGEFNPDPTDLNPEPIEKTGKRILFLGISCLVFVPIFKILTGLPPFMGMILALGIMWIVTDLIHRGDESRQYLLLPNTMSKIDISSILFFLGILLCIDALAASQILLKAAQWMDRNISHPHSIAVVLGLISAVVDNVPLVAAIMGMYGLDRFPTDSSFWQLIAYCAGTGGSILVIGSAAGVAFMGMEKVQFFWYLRKVGIPALLGYFAGIGAYHLFS